MGNITSFSNPGEVSELEYFYLSFWLHHRQFLQLSTSPFYLLEGFGLLSD